VPRTRPSHHRRMGFFSMPSLVPAFETGRLTTFRAYPGCDLRQRPLNSINLLTNHPDCLLIQRIWNECNCFHGMTNLAVAIPNQADSRGSLHSGMVSSSSLSLDYLGKGQSKQHLDRKAIGCPSKSRNKNRYTASPRPSEANTAPAPISSMANRSLEGPLQAKT
jgi:hypothetical protein